MYDSTSTPVTPLASMGCEGVVEKPTSPDWVLGGQTNYFDGEPDRNS